MKRASKQVARIPHLAVVLPITQRSMCSDLFPRMVRVEVGEALREKPHGKSSSAGADS